MKTIAIDAMGGDYAPEAVIQGVNLALEAFPDIRVQLYGDEEAILTYLNPSDRVEIIHTKEKILSDDEPVRSIRKKKDASMVLAARAVKEGRAQALLSAGNTGALLAAGIFIIGRIKNVERPGLLTTLPSKKGLGLDMLDLGANAENSAPQLLQYAILGSFYAQHVRGIKQPRVGLLNNGTEEGKGDAVRKEAFDLLKAEESIHFIGNIEARELLNEEVDVVVTDGFTGNAVLKTMEGTAMAVMSQLKMAIVGGGLRAKLGYLFLKKSLKGLRKNLDYSESGGAVLFGLNAPIVKAHGSSDSKAIFSAIRQVRLMLDTDVVQKSVNYFEEGEK